MSTPWGFYSLVQYRPDAGRAEVANVGVVVVKPDQGLVEAKLSEDNHRARKVFGAHTFDAEFLNESKEGIVTLLKRDAPRSEEDFQKFAGTLANDIILTPLRAIRLNEPKMDAERLFAEYVGEEHPETHPRAQRRDTLLRSLRAEMKTEFQGRKALAQKITWNDKVEVPTVGLKLESSFSYRNGVKNLVYPQVFTGEDESMNAASKLAVCGEYLAKPVESSGILECKLVVVSAYQVPNSAWRNRIHTVLKDHKVNVVERDNLKEFADRVEAEAK